MKKDETIVRSNNCQDSSPAASGRERRRLLKTLAAGGGIGMANVMMPEKWEKPVLDAALLPAHGAASGCDVECQLDIGLNWDTSQTAAMDLDLEVVEPGGIRVAPKLANGVRVGQCIEHGGDGIISATGTNMTRSTNESIQSSVQGFVSAGRYQIYVRNNGSGDQGFSLTTTVCGQSPSGSWGDFVSDGSVVSLGSISISPSGNNVNFRRNTF